MKTLFWVVLLLCFSVISQAKQLGTFGKTYHIEEHDMLTWIQARLHQADKNGELLAWQRQMQADASAQVKRPAPVKHIRSAQVTRTFYFDPSIVVAQGLIDHEGQTFIPAGTKINPLEKITLHGNLLFIDGDDTQQVAWALEQNRLHKSKMILIKGSPLALMSTHEQRFYFDQKGQLVNRLGIEHVPAKVVQEKQLLKITEIKL